jgi:hypothetical protein
MLWRLILRPGNVARMEWGLGVGGRGLGETQEFLTESGLMNGIFGGPSPPPPLPEGEGVGATGCSGRGTLRQAQGPSLVPAWWFAYYWLMTFTRTTPALPFLFAATLIHTAVAAPSNPDSLLAEALKPPPMQSSASYGGVASDKPSAYFVTHAALGTLALTTFTAAMVIGAASGNLGKLMDPNDCCPDGGTRAEPWRGIDRALVRTGMAAYIAAGGMALYNLTVRERGVPREKHNAHRWLAAAHLTAFTTSMVTGIIMANSQDSDPQQFARAARVHTASNTVFVPLLAVSFANIVFE